MIDKNLILEAVKVMLQRGDITTGEINEKFNQLGLSVRSIQECYTEQSTQTIGKVGDNSTLANDKIRANNKTTSLNWIFYVCAVMFFASVQLLILKLSINSNIILSAIYFVFGISVWVACALIVKLNIIRDTDIAKGVNSSLVLLGSLCLFSTLVYIIVEIVSKSSMEYYQILAIIGFAMFILSGIHLIYLFLIKRSGLLLNIFIFIHSLSIAFCLFSLLGLILSTSSKLSEDKVINIVGVTTIIAFSSMIFSSFFASRFFKKDYGNGFFGFSSVLILITLISLCTTNANLILASLWYLVTLGFIGFLIFRGIKKVQLLWWL